MYDVFVAGPFDGQHLHVCVICVEYPFNIGVKGNQRETTSIVCFPKTNPHGDLPFMKVTIRHNVRDLGLPQTEASCDGIASRLLADFETRFSSKTANPIDGL